MNFKKFDLKQLIVLPTYGNIKLSKVKILKSRIKSDCKKWLEALKFKKKLKVNKVFLKLTKYDQRLNIK